MRARTAKERKRDAASSGSALPVTTTAATLPDMDRSLTDLSKPSWPIVGSPDAPAKVDDGTRSQRLKVTGRLKVAIDNMVWVGLKRDDAAAAAGLTAHALYSALRKPHVKAYYLGECEVLRTSGRARRIHRLEEISEASSNLNASVQAIRTLDAPDGANSSMGSGRSAAVTMPGLVIQIIQQSPSLSAPERDVSAKPLITLGRDSLTENVEGDGG